MSASTLRPILVEQLESKTFLMTDDGGQYRNMLRNFRHEVVNHSAGEYVRSEPHTNTIESYFAVLKRGTTGTYLHVSLQHLKRYLAEFGFRHNERAALEISAAQRSIRAVQGVVG